ncbi:ATP-binding protein [Streptomyces sp. NPDC050560]|uniref:ATP-binding protein n=1 Tax=Streptomyces sp. NPDC050560 TaxID=3365630 RepID=UPI0037A2F006
MRRSLRRGRRSGCPTATAGGGNLPLELDSFVGREADLGRLAALLARARLVTVTGPGGIGKSRTAARAAAGRAAPDGVWRVDLSGLREPGLVAYAVLEALALTDRMSRPPRQMLREHLAGRRPLLLLDGYEHVVDECACLVGELLRAAPGLRVLAAGRRPLGVEGERVLPLGPLPVREAVALLCERATAAGFPPEAAPGVLDELCGRLDGVPLAVELAAGRLRALSPGQLLGRLDRDAGGLGVLTGGGQGAPARHRALRTTIGWSHELCTLEERLLWARLSVFSGPFELEAAEYVCGGAGLEPGAVLDLLDELIAQSVVAREEYAGAVRYRMLAAVRDYGAGWLDAAGESGRLRRRHRDWYTGLATSGELDWFSPRQAEVAERIEAELPNLRAALDYCLSEPGETHLGHYLAGTLWFYWVGCGRLAEGRHWLERCARLVPEAAVTGAPPGADGPVRGRTQAWLKALWVLGYVAVLQGDTGPALRALGECRSAAERGGHTAAVAYAVHRTGCVALVGDDLPRAERLLRAALRRYREAGELNSNVLMAQVELAMAVAFQGDLPTAAELCRDVRRVCEDHGERWTLAYALFVLAYVAWASGDTAGARRLLGECLAIDHAFHDMLGSVLAIELLALVTVAEGDAEEAALLQGAAGRMWPSVGLPLFGSDSYGAPHRLCARLVRERIGERRYAELLGAGARLPTDAAVERALGAGAGKDLRPAASGARVRRGDGGPQG